MSKGDREDGHGKYPYEIGLKESRRDPSALRLLVLGLVHLPAAAGEVPFAIEEELRARSLEA